MDKRFIDDLKAQIAEKIEVRKNLVSKNLRLVEEIRNNVKRRKELTREIRDLRHQLARVKTVSRKSSPTNL